MSPRAALDLGEGPIPGTWTLDESDDHRPVLPLSPEGRQPGAFDLAEISSISGDDYTIEVAGGGRTLRLTKLGADGPNLRERLRRLWPWVRTRALRLDGVSERMIVVATSDLGGAVREVRAGWPCSATWSLRPSKARTCARCSCRTSPTSARGVSSTL